MSRCIVNGTEVSSILANNLPVSRVMMNGTELWSRTSFTGLKFSLSSSQDTTLSLIKYGSPTDVSLKYSYDGSTWNVYTIGQEIPLSSNKRNVMFSADGQNETFSSSVYDYYKFKMANESDRVNVSGNIMSIIDETMQTNAVPAYGFQGLFIEFPMLSAPLLPATTLNTGCYRAMFAICLYLTEAPVLNSINLPQSCYERMFWGCSRLSKVSTKQTVFDYNASGLWLRNVSKSGTFECPRALGTNETINRDDSCCPENWTVVNTD